MNSLFIKVGLLTATLTLSACASLAPPSRPAYSGTDSVTSAEPSQLVGSWQVTELNPYPDAEPQNTIIEYAADGTVRGEVIPSGKSAAVLGEDTRFEFLGTWSLTADRVVHQDIQMSTTGSNAMAGLMAKMVNRRQNVAGSANIYELTDNRIVMVGDEGNAMEYVRQ